MPWPSDGAVEKASTAGPNNGVAIFYPITDYRDGAAAQLFTASVMRWYWASLTT